MKKKKANQCGGGAPVKNGDQAIGNVNIIFNLLSVAKGLTNKKMYASICLVE